MENFETTPPLSISDEHLSVILSKVLAGNKYCHGYIAFDKDIMMVIINVCRHVAKNVSLAVFTYSCLD